MAYWPKPGPVTSNTAEHAALEALVRRCGTGQFLLHLTFKAPDCGEAGTTNGVIARALGVSRLRVTPWCKRFLVHQPDELVDLSHSDALRPVRDGQIGCLITLTLENQPENTTQR